MKIIRVEPIPVRIPFRTSFTIAAPFERTRGHVDCLFVRIHTDAGVWGIGETQAWRRQGSSELLPNLVRTVEELFAPLLVGRDPRNINALMETLGEAAYNSLYPQAAVGDALYDLAGKSMGVPVYRLLGGLCRDRVPLGKCISITDSREELLDSAQQAWEAGYRHIRIKIGLDADADLRNVKALAEHFAGRVVLRADANAGMDYPSALRLLKKLEPYDLDMIEQPVAIWDLEGMADLCRHTSIPLSADESLSNLHSLLDIIRLRAAGIIQTKTAKNGGLHHIRPLWELARAAGLQIFPGNHPTTSVGVASVTQLCAAWPGPLMAGDYHTGQADLLADDVVSRPILIRDGAAAVPDGPGLGIEIDEEKLTHYRVDR